MYYGYGIGWVLGARLSNNNFLFVPCLTVNTCTITEPILDELFGSQILKHIVLSTLLGCVTALVHNNQKACSPQQEVQLKNKLRQGQVGFHPVGVGGESFSPKQLSFLPQALGPHQANNLASPPKAMEPPTHFPAKHFFLDECLPRIDVSTFCNDTQLPKMEYA